MMCFYPMIGDGDVVKAVPVQCQICHCGSSFFFFFLYSNHVVGRALTSCRYLVSHQGSCLNQLPNRDFLNLATFNLFFTFKSVPLAIPLYQ